MAKKKKKVVHHRKKKMGAIKTDGSLEAIAGIIVGYLGAYVAEGSIQSLSAAALSGIQIVGGGLLAYFPKNWFIKGVGLGVVANGAGTAAENFGLISGIAGLGSAYDPSRGINGYSDVKRLGTPKPSAVGDNSTTARQSRMYGGCYK